ncbi:MAG: hypothetical protein NTY53_23710 [Kiritimatiellaeota bacterium]|nr:hypothetical protein [Kiritimatiellota bacterium]
MKDMMTDEGSRPLPIHKQEQFAQNVAQGMSYYTAYTTAGHTAKNRNTADVAASRIARLPEVAERIAWLKVRAASGAAMTLAEKIAALETIIRTGSGADKVKAIAR